LLYQLWPDILQGDFPGRLSGELSPGIGKPWTMEYALVELNTVPENVPSITDVFRTIHGRQPKRLSLGIGVF